MTLLAEDKKEKLENSDSKERKRDKKSSQKK